MAPAEQSALTDALQRWISTKLGEAVRVESLARIAGGASRATYRFVLHAPAGQTEPQTLILRLDPASSLIETERGREFAALRALHGTDVPVPRVLWLEGAPDALGAPFFIMESVEGAEAGPMKLMAEPYARHHAAIGRQTWTVLGRLAAADPRALGLDEVLKPKAAGPAWRRELDHWEAVLDADELEPQPVQRAALRWMRRHPPPAPQREAVVHGDYRMGNLMINEQGTLRAVLDWEMVHLGDPLEDLAWSLNRVWCFHHDDRRGGLLARHEAIAVWQSASGLTAEPAALHWWELFACLKGQAIWLSAAREFQSGRVRDSMMALAAWMMCNSQDRASLELLGKLESA
jgi:aminoglycoside phosphotransferase (APT) family kinase protein